MKKLIPLLILLTALNGCTINKAINTTSTKNYQIIGKVGINYNNNNYDNSQFELIKKNDTYELNIISTLGIYVSNINIYNNYLSVDGKEIKQSFTNWMLIKYGWVFPLKHLENILFNKKNKIAVEDWLITKKNLLLKFNNPVKKIKIKIKIKQIKML